LNVECEQVEELAARWVLREDRGLAADESAALVSWLDESTANRVAYLRLKSGWERTKRLAALQGSRYFSADAIKWSQKRLRLAVAAGATILVMLTVGLGIFLHFRSVALTIYTAQLGERPVLRLSDGTRIQLNSNTQVQTNVNGSVRTVKLERGEAFFEVVHDAKRPFVVLAGNRRITDLGTKFSVQRYGDNVRVIVTEGKVQVDILDAPATAAPIIAVSGNVVVAKAEETLVASKSASDIADDLSWRNGILFFDQETLASAADQFNRYNRRHLIVKGEARNIRIGGSFRADNVDVFALLVRNALGLKITQEADHITISQ
jgi:transmembrane sensor